MIRLLQRLREFPVTVFCVVVCGGLFFESSQPEQSSAQRREQLDRLGAVVDRPYYLNGDRQAVLFRAPLALWQGQLWRIPLCAFHHVDFWHLFMNSLSAMYLGRILERRWGSRVMLQFIPLAACLPMIPEFLFGNYVVGFSGVIAAMFGALCVLRQSDAELAEELPDEAVYLGGALLAFGVVFTLVDLMHVANLAHMAGFFWGVLAGCVSTGLPWGRPVARGMRFAAVLLSAVALWFVMHPLGNGTYHWYLAMQTKNPATRSLELERAVELDPQAIGAWRLLASDDLHRKDTMAAWRTLLRGLSQNPTDPQLMKLARIAWRTVIITPGRQAAEQTIAEVFGDQAKTWESQFRSASDWFAATETVLAEINPVIAFPLDRQLDLRLPELPPELEHPKTPHRIPPGGDAVEGRSM